MRLVDILLLDDFIYNSATFILSINLILTHFICLGNKVHNKCESLSNQCPLMKTFTTDGGEWEHFSVNLFILFQRNTFSVVRLRCHLQGL